MPFKAASIVTDRCVLFPVQSIGSDVKQAGRDVASGARQLDRDAKRQVGKAASNLPSAGQLDRDAKRTVGKAVGSDVTSAVKVSVCSVLILPVFWRFWCCSACGCGGIFG